MDSRGGEEAHEALRTGREESAKCGSSAIRREIGLRLTSRGSRSRRSVTERDGAFRGFYVTSVTERYRAIRDVWRGDYRPPQMRRSRPRQGEADYPGWQENELRLYPDTAPEIGKITVPVVRFLEGGPRGRPELYGELFA